MRFYKSKRDFGRDLRMHIHAVEIVKRLLGADVPSHGDVSGEIRKTQKGVYHGDLIFKSQLVKVVGTRSDRIYITPRHLNFLSNRGAIIYYVFFKRTGVIREIRKIEAIELKALERRAFRTRNKYGHPVLVYSREIAELIE